MKVVIEFRRRLRHAIGPFLGLTAVVYFAYHTVQGDRGLFAWWRLNHDVHTAEATLTTLQAEQSRLERRGQLLRPDRLDPDMLEERARVMDNLGRPDEVEIPRRRL